MNNATGTAYVSTGATDANGAYTFTAIPPGTYTLYSGPSSSGPWTPTGDGSYIVPSTASWIDVRTDYNAKGDGSTDDTTAIQNALNAANAAGGGSVYFPLGTYVVSSALSLNDMRSIALQGGSGANQQSTTGVVLKYTGTTGNLFTINSASGISFRDLKFWQSQSSYNGNLVSTDWSAANADPGYIHFLNCTFLGTSGGSCRSLLRLNRAIICTVEKCRFWYGDKAIIGRDTNYSNVIRIKDCAFNNQGTVAIYNAGEEWLIDGCTFEPLASGAAGAYAQDTNYCYALTFQNNWFGDVGAASGTFIAAKALGFAIINNRFGPAGTGGTGVTLTACQAVTITGNRFESATGINFVSAWGVLVSGNDLLTPTTPISGQANAANRAIIANYNAFDEISTALTSSGGLTMAAGTKFTADNGTATGAAGAVTLNKQAGTVTTESLTTAAGATQTYTVTDSVVAATSQVFVTVRNGSNTIQPVYATNVVPGSGSFTVDLRNGHASSALNGSLKFAFWVLP